MKIDSSNSKYEVLFEAGMLVFCLFMPFLLMNFIDMPRWPSIWWLGPYRQYEAFTQKAVGYFQYFVLIQVLYTCFSFHHFLRSYELGLVEIIRGQKYFMMTFRKARRKITFTSLAICLFALIFSQFAVPFTGSKIGSPGFILLGGHLGLLMIPAFIKYALVPYFIDVYEYEKSIPKSPE